MATILHDTKVSMWHALTALVLDEALQRLPVAGFLTAHGAGSS